MKMLIKVISVATPEGLIRAICRTFSFDARSNYQQMVDELVSVIGKLHLQDTQWLGDTYYMPDYLLPGDGIPKPQTGIFKYPWVSCQQKYYNDFLSQHPSFDKESVWNDSSQRWTIPSHREFLYKPLG